MKRYFKVEKNDSVIAAVNNFAKCFAISKIVFIRNQQKVEFTHFEQLIAFCKVYLEADKRHKASTSVFGCKFASYTEEGVLTFWDGKRA